jgi:hypothetical protein
MHKSSNLMCLMALGVLNVTPFQVFRPLKASPKLKNVIFQRLKMMNRGYIDHCALMINQKSCTILSE